MMRIITSLLLACMLAVTSQSMAVARGASAASGQMVICTGIGTMVIYVDEAGQPTSAPHLCPDATLTVLPGTAAATAQAPQKIALMILPQPAAIPATYSTYRPAPPSRGPPLLV